MPLESIELGEGGPRVTRVGLGGCPLGGHGWGRVDDRLAEQAVAKAADLGVNFFDTADCYGMGRSESLLARALGERRHRVVIASKFGVRVSPGRPAWRDNSPQYLREALEASLTRLRLERLPFYYVHWTDGRTPIEEVMQELMRQRQLGKIGEIGLSNCTQDELQRANQVGPVAAVQCQFSLVDQAPAEPSLGAGGAATLVAWGALSQGLLTGKFAEEAEFGANDRRSRYKNFSGAKFHSALRVAQRLKEIGDSLGKTPAQVALRWTLDSGAGVALFGAKSPLQVRDNIGALGWRLPNDVVQELTRLGRAAEQLPAAA